MNHYDLSCSGCVSLRKDRSDQDVSDHGMSKETEESTPRVDSSVPLKYHDPKDLGLICLEKKRKIRFRILSDLRIQFRIFLKKRTLNVHFFEIFSPCTYMVRS